MSATYGHWQIGGLGGLSTLGLKDKAAGIVQLFGGAQFLSGTLNDMGSNDELLSPARGSVNWWRRWHRGIGFPSALFLLWAGATGTLVAAYEFFGPEESLREQLRDVESPVRANAPNTLTTSLDLAMQTVAREAPAALIDKVVFQPKGAAPTVSVFTGKPGGGEDKQFVIDASSGKLISVEAYADKPFIYRLHSGEAFGDGGLFLAMGWGVSLTALTLSGFWLWWRLRRKGATGIRRYFY